MSFIARKNILDGMKPYIDEKIVSQFKKDVAASKDFEPSYIPKHLKR